MLYVVKVRVVLSLPLLPGIGGFPGFAWLLSVFFFELLNASLSRLLTIVGMWGFANGPIGCGKIWVPGLVPGSGLTLFLLHHFLSLMTRRLSHLGFWLNLISLMLSSARPGCLFSVGLVILWSLLISSWISLGISCLRSLNLIFLGSR